MCKTIRDLKKKKKNWKGKIKTGMELIVILMVLGSRWKTFIFFESRAGQLGKLVSWTVIVF